MPSAPLTPRLEVKLLGPMKVAVGDANPRAVASAGQRTVLGLLALRAGTTVAADDLIDELWKEAPPAKARNALQATVARLRRALRCTPQPDPPDELIHASGAGYVLDLPENAVDAHRFTYLAAKGMRLASTSPAAAAALLDQALSLWQGAALADAGGGVRCLAASVKLEEVRISAQEELLALQIRDGKGQLALGPLRELSVWFPDRERVCELLMTALYDAGRQADALNEFHRIRRWLTQELGVEPGPRLHRLYSNILRGGLAVAERMADLSGRSPESARDAQGDESARLCSAPPRR